MRSRKNVLVGSMDKRTRVDAQRGGPMSDLCIRDKFHQRAIRIPKIDADTVAARAGPVDGANLDLDSLLRQMSNGAGDFTRPDETQVTSSRLDGKRGVRSTVRIRAMTVQLNLAEPIGESGANWDYLGAHYVAIEPIGAIPVPHMNDAMIENYVFFARIH